MPKTNLVKNAMLAVQRYPWEQGVCMQALYELGDTTTAFAMAYDAVLRQTEDGRLAVTGENIAVTDPAANGEVVYKAFTETGDNFYKNAANKMLQYLLNVAPRTENGTLCHNEISFHEGFSPNQIWVDSIYMAPPFLAVMGKVEEAYAQICQMIDYLYDTNTELLFHIFDAEQNRFVRKKVWATGNGWALLGIARVITEAHNRGLYEIENDLIEREKKFIGKMSEYQLSNGCFHDILNEEDSFEDAASAMMFATTIYRGLSEGWLDEKFKNKADIVYKSVDSRIDDLGIIHGVCGCPHFVSEGSSAESMAAYLMMQAWKEKTQ